MLVWDPEGADDRIWTMPLIKGRWVDFLVHKHFATAEGGGGFIEAWVDHEPIHFKPCSCTRLHTQTMNADQQTTFTLPKASITVLRGKAPGLTR